MERSTLTLSQALEKHLCWHRARLECFTGMILALIGAKNVQLPYMAQHFGGGALPESRVKRFYRLLRHQSMDFGSIARVILELLPLPRRMTLAMDRTNWEWGGHALNFLVLGVVYQNITIPLLWARLDHKGNTDTAARMALMSRFLQLFAAERIHCLLADREFIGEDWFHWLGQHKIPFCLRLRENMLASHPNGGTMSLKRQAFHLAVGESHIWPQKKLCGVQVQILALRLKGDDFLLLATPVGFAHDIRDAYRQRWSIECLFKAMKSNGFSWEKTHITHLQRSEKLLALLALAAALCVRAGTIAHTFKPIPFRKTVAAPLFSFFRQGIERLVDALNSPLSTHRNPAYNSLFLKIYPLVNVSVR